MRKQLSENEFDIILNTVRRLYDRKAKIALYKYVYKTHPADMATVFRYLEPIQRRDIFKYILRMEGVNNFIVELDEAIIEQLFDVLPAKQISNIISTLPKEDIAFVIDNIDEDLAISVQNLLEEENRHEVEEMLQYAEDSAGRIMSTHFVTFNENVTIDKATQEFHKIGEDTDVPFYIYIVNDKEQMVGVLSLRQLLVNPPKTPLKKVMQSEFIGVTPETDQETAANLVSQYNLLALPVIDSDNQLVGVITVDDVMDVIEEEATEDILKMAGAGDDQDILLKSTFENARLRFPWLLASWFGGVVALGIIGYFNELLTNIMALAAFIPIIIGMGGNVGTQTTTIVVRGIATGRVNISEASKMIFKEIRVGMLLGVIYGILLGLLAYFRYIDYSAPVLLGIVVAISIFIAMSIACIIGSFFPVLLHKLDFDPAISTGPFVTTAIDILGVLIYFSIAKYFLPI
jgi:magnesium transporter